MFVKVINATEKNWYSQGEVHEVENFSRPPAPGERALFRLLSENAEQVTVRDSHTVFATRTSPGIAVADCEIIGMTASSHSQDIGMLSLEEQLSIANASVASLQKQIENRPLTQEQYDAIVAKWRASAYRSRWIPNTDNWTAVVSMDQASPISRCSNISYLCFGVCFRNQSDCVAAIDNVGADNLRKAIQFDMQIGM